MARKIHPDRFVTFIRSHVEVTPGFRDSYTAGQELQFGSVNSARAFVKAINEGADKPICRIGKKKAKHDYDERDVRSIHGLARQLGLDIGNKHDRRAIVSIVCAVGRSVERNRKAAYRNLQKARRYAKNRT